MASSFNRVILLGNLTRDVEIRYIPSGMAVTDIGLAVNDRRKNQSGEWTEETTFVDVTLWGRTAEVAGEYLSKGSPILIEGRLKLESWETEGQKRSKLKVVGERMQMVGGRSGGNVAEAGESRRASRSVDQNEYNQPAAVSASEPPAGNETSEDIPF
jgi:single-strand DNA-binding protein